MTPAAAECLGEIGALHLGQGAAADALARYAEALERYEAAGAGATRDAAAVLTSRKKGGWKGGG